MKLPKHLHIGMRKVKVMTLARPNAENAHGLCFYDEELIKVDTTRQSHYQAEILLHEILHKCADVYSLGLEDEDDERMASVMGTALAQTFRDNPKLLKYLSAVLGGENV